LRIKHFKGTFSHTVVAVLLTSILAMAFGVSLFSTRVGYSSPPLSNSDIVGVGIGDGGTNPMLFRMDQNGTMLWEKSLPFGQIWVPEYYADRNITEDSFYLNPCNYGYNKIGGNNRIQKYDANGNLLWDIAFSPDTQCISANPVDGGIYVTDTSLGVYKLNGNGNIIWGPKTFGYTTPGWAWWGVSTDVTDGGAFVSHPEDDVVLKIDKDGNVLWEQTIPEGYRLNANPIDGGVYVGAGSYACNTYKLGPDGNIEWVKYNFPSPYTYPRGVSPVDGAIYISSGWPDYFVKAATDGTVLWSVPNTVSPGYDRANNAIAPDIEGNYVYTSTNNLNLGINKFSGLDCTLIWHVDPGYYAPKNDYTPEYLIWIGTPSAAPPSPAPAPVGGIAFSPDKLALLAPYIILAALIAIAAVSVTVYWRRYRK
jgi:hypothetical protein